MRANTLVFILAALTSLHVWAQPIVISGLDGGGNNADAIRAQQLAGAKAGKSSFSLPGDSVIPQVVDGAGWKTTFVFHNVDTKTVRFRVFFLKSDGTDMSLPMVGQGAGVGITLTLPVAATAVMETVGDSTVLSQGWAYVDRENAGDGVAGLAVFRQRLAGKADQEAVVPIASEFGTRFILVYDNTQSYVTSMAIANPDSVTAPVDVTIRDQNGAVVRQTTTNLRAFERQAFSTASVWPETANRRGSIEFRTGTGSFGVSALGLRFHPSGSFTSFHTLANYKWLLD